MRPAIRHALPLLALCAATVAGAQSMKPGLWEMQSSMQQGNAGQQNAMAQMRQQMDSMPPAQRKQMEAMLAKQGMSLAGDGMRMKTCITPEMAARYDVPPQREEGGCTTRAQPRVGNTVRFSYQCANPPSQGEGAVTWSGSDAYSMRVETTTTVRGKAEKSTVESSGRWLAADCGSVKPLAAMAGQRK
ncbi:MAG: DUF3617 domain-containing protein [Acidovorax sp.]|uniref:DUF3617 domain-containing protein n=1 Tax=Acidovorax sp. TaxID=1872122 RepID=UPI0039E38D74